MTGSEVWNIASAGERIDSVVRGTYDEVCGGDEGHELTAAELETFRLAIECELNLCGFPGGFLDLGRRLGFDI